MTHPSRNHRIATFVAFLLAAGGACGRAQTAQITQQVNQRHTLGDLSSTASGSIGVGTSVTFHYQLFTAGAPAPTTETVQFFDGANPLGSPVSLGLEAASNLLPNSHIDPANGWTTAGSAPAITPKAANGPDGSTNTATTIAFPDTTGGPSSIQLAVPSSTNYSGLPVTASFWVLGQAAGSLTIRLTDSPQTAASNAGSCPVTTSWTRCTLTYTFPAGSGTGFALSIVSTGSAPQTVSIWGPQVEQADHAGPYVSTLGTARPTGGQAGLASFTSSGFTEGTHVITVKYAGDTNFVASTSNPITLTLDKGTSSVALSATPTSPTVYGTPITLTAVITGSGVQPTGTVQFMDGATVLGTGTIDSSGNATLTLQGSTALPAGSHNITAVYSGDTNFNGATSSALPFTVTKLPANQLTMTLTSSLNPSTYGDQVIFTVSVTSPVGVMPTGTVTLTDGATNLGTGTLDATGKTTVTAAVFDAGSHTITATYSGDENYQ
jgi:hypothetical protein